MPIPSFTFKTVKVLNANGIIASGAEAKASCGVIKNYYCGNQVCRTISVLLL